MTTKRSEVEQAIETWLTNVQDFISDYYSKSFPHLAPPKVVTAGGTKYLKIRFEEEGGSIDRPSVGWRAYAFIDLSNGNIYRPATYKAPALPHPRGNVLDEHGGMKWVGPYGMAYLENMKEGA